MNPSETQRFWFAIGRLCFFAPEEGSFWYRLRNLTLHHDEAGPRPCFYCGRKTLGTPYRVSKEYVYPACCIRDECLAQWNYVHISKTPSDIDAVTDRRDDPGMRATYGFLDETRP